MMRDGSGMRLQQAVVHTFLTDFVPSSRQQKLDNVITACEMRKPSQGNQIAWTGYTPQESSCSSRGLAFDLNAPHPRRSRHSSCPHHSCTNPVPYGTESLVKETVGGDGANTQSPSGIPPTLG